MRVLMCILSSLSRRYHPRALKSVYEDMKRSLADFFYFETKLFQSWLVAKVPTSNYRLSYPIHPGYCCFQESMKSSIFPLFGGEVCEKYPRWFVFVDFLFITSEKTGKSLVGDSNQNEIFSMNFKPCASFMGWAAFMWVNHLSVCSTTVPTAK